MLLWVLDSLRLQRAKHEVFIVYHTSLRAHGFVRTVREHWLAEDARRSSSSSRGGGEPRLPRLPRLLLHEVSYRTRGAAETALGLLNALPPAALRRPTITLDCDVGYGGSDILGHYEAAVAAAAAAAGGTGTCSCHSIGSSLP